MGVRQELRGDTLGLLLLLLTSKERMSLYLNSESFALDFHVFQRHRFIATKSSVFCFIVVIFIGQRF